MGLIDNVIDSIMDGLRFKDTIFYKVSNDLQSKYNSLNQLNIEFPNNENLMKELYIVKRGLDGENEIAYQLKKSNIGMYVLRDVKFKYKDLTAQIDYIIITPVYIYYVECKNLIGNITVTDKGDFIRELVVNGKKVKKGIYSPLRQVEAQREVIRKIWESKASKFKKVFSSKNFEYYRRVLVVAANPDTILNTNHAPKNMKYKILRADALIRQIEYDFKHRDSDEFLCSQKNMEEIAQTYVNISVEDNIDYYEFYKNKYCNNSNTNNSCSLKDRLIELRKNRANQMRIPAYYIFTNNELEKLIEAKPKTVEELKSLNILSSVKIKTHGEEIVTEINKNC